ncbi:Nardilysin [Trachymyrmex cornetzi]|uniref:Nardilysin n=1 Tax=Trachymyrmex cornetzi TaxID=471704 RepID=A0A151JC35_9HYME|nr:Nardilysin [Trachymyrmex cornetzi]
MCTARRAHLLGHPGRYVSSDRPIDRALHLKPLYAFCGLCVRVGSFSDPPEVSGLAHFLQCKVFMGSEMYLQENGFNEFISLHDGTTDGKTDCEYTRFYFDILERYCLNLDRFVQCFIEPLMKKDAITRKRDYERFHNQTMVR